MANPIRELVISVKVDADTSGFAKMDDAQQQSQTKSVALGGVIANLTTKLLETGLAAAKAGAAFVADLVFGSSKAADALTKTAQQLDITAEGLQRVRGAATLTGGDASTLDKGVRTLTKGLAKAVEGTGPAADALKQLGLEVADIDSFLQAGDIEGALGEIGDKFNSTADSAQKNAALLDLFGAAGSKLRPLIEQGSEGIKGLGDEIAATGSIIDDEALAQFEELEDAQFLLDQTTQGLKNTIATALAPAITDIAKSVQEWVTENDQFISQDLPAILSDVGTSAVELAEFVLDLVESWREFARDASDLAEIMTEDLEPGLSSVGEAVITLTDFTAGLALAWSDLALELLEAAGAGDEVLEIFKQIQAAIPGGGEEEVRVERGAGAQQTAGTALEGGGTRTTTRTNAHDPRFETEAKASGDSSKLRKLARDPGTSPAVAARYTLAANTVDNNEAAKAVVKADQASAARSAAIGASRSRIKAAKKRGRRGGGGKRAAPAASAKEEASVDDIIAGAIGAATGGPSKAASDNALAGTMLITVDQSVNITNGPVTIELEVPASIVESGDIEALGDVMAARFVSIQSVRDANDFFIARQNVGGG